MLDKKLFRFTIFLKPYYLVLIFILLISVIQSVLTALNILILPEILFSLDSKRAIPNLQSDGNILNYLNAFKVWLYESIKGQSFFERMLWFAYLILILFLLKNILDYSRRVIIAWFQVNVITDMRVYLFDRIQRLSIYHFGKKEIGHFFSLMGSDIGQILTSLKRIFEFLVTDPLLILNILIQILFISWKLSISIIIAVPIAGYVLSKIGDSLSKKSEKVYQYLDCYTSFLKEAFVGMKIIKMFNAEAFQKKRFKNLLNRLKKAIFKQDVMNSLSAPVSEVFGVGIVFFVLVFGAYMVEVDSNITGVDIATILTGLIMIIEPVKRIARVFNEMKIGLVAADRVSNILEKPIDSEEYGNKNLTTFCDKIEINISEFRYEKDDPFCLAGIKFSIQKGKTVALVGSSGSGKTTLATLLARLYRLKDNEIKIDGVNFNDISNDALRRLISIVPQHTFLFDDTFEANIVFNSEKKDFSYLKDISIRSHTLPFIKESECGFKSNIGENGNNLSGGQKQRLAIARALYKNAPILILDEATSALDSESEKIIQNIFDEMMRETTVLVIAHRLSTIKNADKIVVLENGQIIEVGTHEELLKKNGKYTTLYRVQYEKK